MLRSTETMPVPSRGSSTVVLSTSNSRSEPSLGSTSSSSRASGRRFDGGARQRRREQHVVQLDGAPAAFALFLGRRKQLLGARVRDDQPSFGVGQQNRVGDRVDDGEEQRALAPQLADFLGEAAAAANLLDLLAEHRREPADVGRRPGPRPQQQQPERLAARSLRRRAAGSTVNGPAPSGVVGVTSPMCPLARPAAEGDRTGRGQRGDERIARVGQRPGEELDVARWRRRSRRSRRARRASLSTARQTDRFTPAWRASHSRLACAHRGNVFVVNEVVLEQLEP